MAEAGEGTAECCPCPTPVPSSLVGLDKWGGIKETGETNLRCWMREDDEEAKGECVRGGGCSSRLEGVKAYIPMDRGIALGKS